MLLHQPHCPLALQNREPFEALVLQLAQTVPLWRMECNMDPQAADISHKAMSE